MTQRQLHKKWHDNSDTAVTTNVSINNEHPVIITYNYTDNSTTVANQFETLDLNKVSALKPGDAISGNHKKCGGCKL